MPTDDDKTKGSASKPFSSMTDDELITFSKTKIKDAPIEIPTEAKIKPSAKNGYDQVTYTWKDETFKYEARWHTRTPGAPIDQGNTWVVQRTIPGNGGTKPQTFFKSGDDWVEGYKWYDAIKARQNGNATPIQEKILDLGHWKE